MDGWTDGWMDEEITGQQRDREERAEEDTSASLFILS